ncbi:MAG: hypothetical protein QOG71_3861 [Pyrinomonadaceae bacterium]|nr:hypothetical protein [Pyrinomonadaceae bacterium]
MSHNKHLKIGILFFTLCSLISLPVTAYSPGRYEIVNTAFTVGAGKAKYFNFRVTGNRVDVQGRFRAEGGSGNDIKVLILDSDGFENWRNGHQTSTYYNSGKRTVGNITAQLGPGDYVLVYDNTFSAMSNKAITTNAEVQW